jgi:hypothetical protein
MQKAPTKLGMAEAEQETPKFRHISDIDVWLTPDRNYFTFILLSVFCGFFALDHVYLRSFDTAFQKVLYNFFGLGIWYWWDMCQIFTEGKRVQSDGLTSPFDWIQGIGRGVFATSGVENKYMPEKSYIIWAFLAIFGGFFALDKFYLGDYIHAFTKLISIFSPIFLFGILWVAWDAFHAFFMTKETIANKISLPIPLTWFGYNETDGSVFLPSAAKKDAGAISAIAQVISGVPIKQWINLGTLAGFGPLADAAKQLTGKLGDLKEKASSVAQQPQALLGAAVGTATNAAAALPPQIV